MICDNPRHISIFALMDGPELQVFLVYVYHIKTNLYSIIALHAALLAVMFKTTQRNTHGKNLQVQHKSFL